MHAIVLGFGGVPVIWMGDELGLLNDPDWQSVPEHAGDNRWAHRPALPWPPPEDSHGVRASLADADRGSQGAAAPARRRSPPRCWIPQDPGVLLVARRHPLGAMLGAYNVTDTDRVLPYQALRDVGLDPEARGRPDHRDTGPTATTRRSTCRRTPCSG